MHWFKESIGDAIKLCHQLQCGLIVFVSDEQEASIDTLMELENEEIAAVLKEHKFVALKIIKDSMEFQQFSQFYNVFFFPSIFCISFLGQEVITMQGRQDARSIKMKFFEAFMEMDKITQRTNEGEHIQNDSFNSAKMDLESAESDSKLDQAQANDTSLERLEHVKTDRANSDSSEEMMTNTKDGHKRGRNNNKVQHESCHQVKAELTKGIEMQEQNAAIESSHIKQRHRRCRVQLRLPQGSTKVVEMKSDDTLSILRHKVFEILSNEDTVSSISLIRTYPRQELTDDMNELNMKDLSLSPSGTVIVKFPVKSEHTSSFAWILFMAIPNFILWFISSVRSALSKFIWSPSNEDPNRSTKEKQTDKGKIHRLFSDDDDDSDKDDGTYNGNSTQQQ